MKLILDFSQTVRLGLRILKRHVLSYHDREIFPAGGTTTVIFDVKKQEVIRQFSA